MNSREDVLLQIWRDYYDEILEVNLDKGTFESQINTDESKNRKGFLSIEVMIMANKMIHPDDKKDFLKFFDPKKILEDMKNDIFVNKLNFRAHKGDNKYFWVKVKGIMPSRRMGEDTMYFACFRILDSSSEEDYGYMQRISTDLMYEKERNTNMRMLASQYIREVRGYISDIIGMTDISKRNTDNPSKLIEGYDTIREQAEKIDLLLDDVLAHNAEKEIAPIISEVDMKEEKPGKTSVMQRKHTENEDDEALNGDEADSGEVKAVSYEGGIIPKAENFSFDGFNIMAVEDSKLSGRIMKEMLDASGANSSLFENGKEAIKAFIKEPEGHYDLILIDAINPDFDCTSITNCLRLSCKEYAETVPIIIITDRQNAKVVRKELGQQITALFMKPVDFGLLFMKMDELLQKKHPNESVNH